VSCWFYWERQHSSHVRFNGLLWGLNRELAAHFGRVLVGIEAGKQMHNVIRQSHDGFNPRGF
jgi:hypothetical protein